MEVELAPGRLVLAGRPRGEALAARDGGGGARGFDGWVGGEHAAIGGCAAALMRVAAAAVASLDDDELALSRVVGIAELATASHGLCSEQSTVNRLDR